MNKFARGSLLKLTLALTVLVMVSGCVAVPVGPAYGPAVDFGFYGGGGGYRGGYGGEGHRGGYGGGYRR